MSWNNYARFDASISRSSLNANAKASVFECLSGEFRSEKQNFFDLFASLLDHFIPYFPIPVAVLKIASR